MELDPPPVSQRAPDDTDEPFHEGCRHTDQITQCDVSALALSHHEAEHDRSTLPLAHLSECRHRLYPAGWLRAHRNTLFFLFRDQGQTLGGGDTNRTVRTRKHLFDHKRVCVYPKPFLANPMASWNLLGATEE